MKGADARIIEVGRGTVAAAVVVLRMLLLGCLLAATLGARPLLGWAEGLNADTQAGVFVIEAARRWHGAMLRVGVAGPYDSVHASLKRLEGWHF